MIRDLYKMHDQAVGHIMSLTDSDTGVILLSDHGHGPRPTTVFNINEMLRRNGWLKSNKGRSAYSSKAKARIRNTAIQFVQDFGLGNLAGRILSLYPKWKEKVSAESSIDWGSSLACVSNFSPFKSYSYGGIWVNSQLLGPGKNDFVQTLLDTLIGLKHPDTGEPIVKWAKKCKDLYQGDNISLYPDILLELKNGLGFGQEVNCDLIQDGNMHRIQPGSHKLDTPVLGIRNIKIPQEAGQKTQLTLMDIAPMILSFLGIENKDGIIA